MSPDRFRDHASESGMVYAPPSVGIDPALVGLGVAAVLPSGAGDFDLGGQVVVAQAAKHDELLGQRVARVGSDHELGRRRCSALASPLTAALGGPRPMKIVSTLIRETVRGVRGYMPMKPIYEVVEDVPEACVHVRGHAADARRPFHRRAHR